MINLYQLSTFFSQFHSTDHNLGMRHFEIMGAPGSGKSTLLQHLGTVSSVTVNHQNIYFLAFDSLTNGTIPVNQLKKLSERLYWKLYHNIKGLCIDKFTKEFPGVIEIIDVAGNIDNRSHYPAMYYSAAAEYICLRDFISTPFVLDEGLVQLAGEVTGQDPYLRERFLKTIPVPDCVIYVRCSAEKCWRRQKQREKGLASSLAGLDRLDAIDRLEQYNECFDSAARILRDRGVKVVEVDSENYSIENCYEQVFPEFVTLISKKAEKRIQV